MRTWARRFVEHGWLWRGPVLVAATILAVTSVVALVQQRESVRRRELLFESRADQVRQDVLGVIDREGERFRTAVDFVAVTHPGRVDQFRAYFQRQAPFDDAEIGATYNFMLIERVSAADFESLRERERALGNRGFAVRSLSSRPGDRFVITRTAAPPLEGGIELSGLDVTGFEPYFPAGTPDQGYALRVMEPGPLLQMLLAIVGEPEGSTAEGIEALSTLVMLVSPVTTARPSTGWVEVEEVVPRVTAVRLISVGELLAPLDRGLTDGFTVSLLAEGHDEPIAVVDGLVGRAAGSVDLQSTFDLITDGQGWSLVVTADQSYDPSTGLFDHIGTWTFGLTTAVLAAATLLARNWHGRRLVRTEQELASALTVASTDGLTGLLNRVGFIQRSAAINTTTPATMMFIDLDGFKAVNDLEGHEAGDEVLRRVADVLSTGTRPSDLVSRLGGDEFIIYLPGWANPDLAGQLASRLIDAIGGVDHRLSCSIGISFRAVGEMAPVDELLRRADAAMYKVKRSGGRGYHVASSVSSESDAVAEHAVEGAGSRGGAEAGELWKRIHQHS